MDPFDDDYSSDDDMSVIEEPLEQAIKEALLLVSTYPAPCPVCFECQYSFHDFKDQKAMLQHAQAMDQNRDRKYIKVKHLHKELSEIITAQMEQEFAEDSSLHGIAPVVSRCHVSTNVSEALKDMERMTYDINEKRQQLEELRSEKLKKQRQICKVTNLLDETHYQLSLFRKQSDLYAQEAMKVIMRFLRLAEFLLGKELETYEDELSALERERSQSVAAHEAKIATLRKQLESTAAWLSHEERIGLSEKIRDISQKCIQLRREKESLQMQIQERRRLKQEAEETMKKASRCKDRFEKRVQLLEHETKKAMEIDDNDCAVTISQFQTLGLEVPDLPSKCVGCQCTFQQCKDEHEKSVCKRIIFEICNCADHCRDCFHKLTVCPRHKCSVGEGIPFQTYA